MSGDDVSTASYWDHREARRIVGPAPAPASGARSPAASAAAQRAAEAKNAEDFWEPHYASTPASTEGPLPGPNPVLLDVATDLAPGTALDLGCGQGGDALWLARHGWQVTTVDVSATALERVTERAEQAGLSQRVRVERHDLSATFPQGGFDLVNAQYFHSPVAMDRAAALARAAGAVNPGGMLLVVDHASVAPWSWSCAEPGSLPPTAHQILDGFGLDLAAWQVVAAEDRDRQAEGPGGQRAGVTDTVIALVRRAPVGA